MNWSEIGGTITIINTIFGFIGGLTMIYQGIRFVRLRRTLQKKMKDLIQPSKQTEIIINLSGHPMVLSENDWLMGKNIINIPTGNIKHMEKLEEEAEQLLNMLDMKLIKDMSIGLPVVFSFPGMSGITQILIPKLHAIIGKFPLVTLPIHSQEGWIWREPIDLQIIRTNTRLRRSNFSDN